MVEAKFIPPASGFYRLNPMMHLVNATQPLFLHIYILIGFHRMQQEKNGKPVFATTQYLCNNLFVGTTMAGNQNGGQSHLVPLGCLNSPAPRRLPPGPPRGRLPPHTLPQATASSVLLPAAPAGAPLLLGKRGQHASLTLHPLPKRALAARTPLQRGDRLSAPPSSGLPSRPSRRGRHVSFLLQCETKSAIGLTARITSFILQINPLFLLPSQTPCPPLTPQRATHLDQMPRKQAPRLANAMNPRRSRHRTRLSAPTPPFAPRAVVMPLGSWHDVNEFPVGVS